jgi:GTP cyclohydrolase II
VSRLDDCKHDLVLPRWNPTDNRRVPDGKVCLNAEGELAVTKFAVEPVWYLPGVAERFGIDEATLRRSLFEHTGGSYPELITRGDIKVFLPPIGGLTVYCFGDPAKMSDESVRLSLRIHDECNGSDVFGSDICTCRPYLIFGIEEAVKEAQNGGSGVVIYFRKEGRALGEVTKVSCSVTTHGRRSNYVGSTVRTKSLKLKLRKSSRHM